MPKDKKRIRSYVALTVCGTFLLIGAVGAFFPGTFDWIEWWGALMISAAVGLVVYIYFLVNKPS